MHFTDVARQPWRALPMRRQDVYIVIPAYNEATRLRNTIEGLKQHFPQIVVVDDGSADNTLQVARQCGVKALRHVINRGQGAALQTGITYSLREGAEFIVTFDADGQHQPADIPAMLIPVMTGAADITLGSRFLANSSDVPRSRRVLLHAARFFTWLTSGLMLSDCHNGFRVLSRRAAERICFHQDRMAHASELIDQIRLLRLSYVEVPVAIRYSRETLAKGQSTFDAFGILIDCLVGRLLK
jgi:polyprenyl-phospho-N-acetylgalactosaminyl synthase